MKKLLVAALLSTGLMSLAHADSDDWIFVSRSQSGTVYEGQRASGHLATDTNGNQVYIGMFRVREGNSTTYEQNHLKPRDCDRGYGRAVTVDVDGKYITEYQWNLDGSTVGDKIAKVLCLAYKINN